jgi:hypothetical protein
MVALESHIIVGDHEPADTIHEFITLIDDVIVSNSFKQWNYASDVYIVGDVFPNVHTTTNTELTSGLPVTSPLESLIRNFWGHYCAIHINKLSGCISILPEPTGSCDFYFTRMRSGILLSTSFGWIVKTCQRDAAPRLSSCMDAAMNLDRFGHGTVAENIFRIPHGCVLSIDRNRSYKLSRVWPYCLGNRRHKLPDVAEQLNNIIVQTLDRIANKHTAIFLSGGRDSSLLSGLYKRTNISSRHSPNYVHVHDANKSADEFHYVEYVKDKLGGNLYLVPQSEFLTPFSQLWTDSSRPVRHVDLEFAKNASLKTNADILLDGKLGDTVFMNTVEAGFLCDSDLTKIVNIRTEKTLPLILKSKIYSKYFPKSYLSSYPATWLRNFTDSKIVTSTALSMKSKATNYRSFRNDISYYLSKTNASKTSYVLYVMQDVIQQNTIYNGSLNPVYLPYGFQPVLDFLFSISVDSYVGENTRSLQRMMLDNIGLKLIAERNHKSTTGAAFLSNISQHEDILLEKLEKGYWNRNGLIDLKNIENSFLAFRCGVVDISLPAIVSILNHEHLIEQLELNLMH